MEAHGSLLFKGPWSPGEVHANGPGPGKPSQTSLHFCWAVTGISKPKRGEGILGERTKYLGKGRRADNARHVPCTPMCGHAWGIGGGDLSGFYLAGGTKDRQEGFAVFSAESLTLH